MTDTWTDRLSEYLDGDLPAAETAQLEAHLRECAACAATLQELRAVVFRAGQIVDRPPEQDLWQGIAARIAQSAPKEVGTPGTRTFAFSVPQLVAASIVLMLLSGGTMYLMLQPHAPQQVAGTLPGVATRHDTVSAPAPAPETAPAAVVQERAAQPVSTRAAAPVERNYNSAIKELEDALAQNRTHLDTATVRVLETNLRTIDNAIAEARAALGNDPGNPYLNHYLDQTLQKKIQLLRRATGILRART